MNVATAFVLAVVVAVVALAAYGTYRLAKTNSFCYECSCRGQCSSNPINCTVREK